jgi:hypothetical protein
MKAKSQMAPHIVPVDDDHARMIAYARSAEGRARIAKGQAEIAAGRGITPDDAYFEDLDRRIAERVAARPAPRE